MKKYLFLGVLSFFALKSEAKEMFSTKLSCSNEFVEKAKFTKNHHVNSCATSSSSLQGTCWTATATVTFCCDCDAVTAGIGASVAARNLVLASSSVLDLLDSISGC